MLRIDGERKRQGRLRLYRKIAPAVRLVSLYVMNALPLNALKSTSVHKLKVGYSFLELVAKQHYYCSCCQHLL